MKDAKIEGIKEANWLNSHVMCGFERHSSGSTDLYLFDTYSKTSFRLSSKGINKLREYLNTLEAEGSLKGRRDA